MSNPNFDALTAPFGDDKIEWRVQSSGNRDGRPWAKVVPHPEARYLMDRLDEACGPENWRVQYVRGPAGGVVCDLAIRVGDEWISKEDGASTDGDSEFVDPVKSSLTNAFKRACVPWNVGGIRSLYHVGTQWAEIHKGGSRRDKIDGEFRNWDPPSLSENGGGSGKDQQRPANEDSGAEAEPEPSTLPDDPRSVEGGKQVREKLRAWFVDAYGADAGQKMTEFVVKCPGVPSNADKWDAFHFSQAWDLIREHGQDAAEDPKAFVGEQQELV